MKNNNRVNSTDQKNGFSVDEVARLFFRASAADFKKIPGSPIAYWVSVQMRHIFETGMGLKKIGDTRQGMATSDNNNFLRFWAEVSFEKSHINAKTREDAAASFKKWFPYNKGGDFRKWYGNSDYFVNWESDGKELMNYAASLYGSPTRTIKSSNYSSGVQSPHGGLWGFPLKRLNQCVQQIDALLA
jgi:type II restriction/modification system DNA methylase subunit YeeA